MTSGGQIHVLLIDDSRDDALLISDAISAENAEVIMSRVDDAAGLRHALSSQPWDVVICDYSMPCLTTAEALRIVQDADADLPFIVVSGVIGEDAAVEVMRAGAVDYLMKDRLARLLPAIRREMRDVETRKGRDAAEASLNDLRVRLQATVERAPVGIVNLSRDGRFIHVNPRFCEMLGYTCDELLDLTVADITHPDDDGRDAGSMRLMARGELDEYRTETRYVRKDGTAAIVNVSTAPVRDAAGEFQYFASIMLDITEMRLMESALREGDERYRQIVDTAQEGIWTVDAANRTTFVNRRMADMLGYTEAGMIGRHLHDFVSSSETTRVDHYAKRREEGLSDEDDFLMRRQDGSRIRIHFTANPLLAPNGTYAGALAMVTDVTARWKAEETVLRQKEELEEAQRIAHLGSWRRELPGDVIEFSDELYRIWGFEADTIVTVAMLMDAILPEDRGIFVTAVADAEKSGTPIDVVYRLVRPDGSQRSLHTVGEITPGIDGAPRRIRGITQDITERVSAAAVHESLDRHVQLLLQSTTQGIFGLGTDGRCTFINRAASESLGYSATELVGVAMHDVIHPTHEGASYAPDDCPIQTAVCASTASEVQSDSLARRDGTMLPVEYSVAPIFDGGVAAGAVVVFTDVSERKLLQAQLQQSDRVSSLGRLAATMAHEFNNVLMGIQPFAELLSRQNPGETIQRATQNILQAVQRGRSITHGILRFAKPSEPVKESIEVAGWLRSMATAMTAVLGDRISLDLRADDETLVVRGDRHQLDQVLTNLASNARDAMPAGGTFSVLLERSPSGYVFPYGAVGTTDQYVHLRISDTGCGMDAKTLKSIFDPFFTMKRSGTGLGLAVVHQVMQLHGGSVIAESVVGEGTTFHLFLPFCDEPRGETARRPALVSHPSIASILMIEDDETISSGVASLLRDEGLRVDVATTGAAGLAALALRVPDAVLLDVGLPDIDGRLLYERMAIDHPDMAFVFASGSSDEEVLRPYLKTGQIASLTKPYEFAELLEVLATLDVVHDPLPPAEALQ